MKNEDAAIIISAVGDAVRPYVARTVAASVEPIVAQLRELDERAKNVPAGPKGDGGPSGPAGRDGVDGKDADPLAVAAEMKAFREAIVGAFIREMSVG